MKGFLPRKKCLLLYLAVTLAACQQNSVGRPDPTYGFPALKQLWHTDIPAFNGPALAGNVILGERVDDDNTKLLDLTAVHLDTHARAWSVPGYFVGQQAVFYNGLIIYNADNMALRVLRPDGTFLKSVAFPAAVASSRVNPHGHMQVFGTTLIVPVLQSIVAYDLMALLAPDTSPAPLWVRQHPTEAGVQSIDSLALDAKNRVVYYASSIFSESPARKLSVLYAVNALSGKELWEKTLDDVPHYRPGLVEVGADDGLVAAVVDGDAEFMAFNQSGQQLWKNPHYVCPSGATTVYSYIEVKDGLVLPVPDGDNCVTAWDAKTGAKKWEFTSPLEGTFANQPLVLNGVVYASNTKTWALDADSGKVLGVSGTIGRAQSDTGTVLYDAQRDQLLVWGQQLVALRPVRDASAGF